MFICIFLFGIYAMRVPLLRGNLGDLVNFLKLVLADV